LDHADGLIRLAAGSTVSARAALEAAVAGWDARGRIWEATWGRLDLATCLVRGNRYAEALVVLERVREVATRLGSSPILERAGEAGARPRWPARAVASALGPRVRGREAHRPGPDHAEIGEQIFVSPKTISAHVEHILAKLGVARRAEIAAWTSTIAAPVERTGTMAEVPAPAV
jgi:hypothetical protein